MPNIKKSNQRYNFGVMDWIQLAFQTDQDKADFVSEALMRLGKTEIPLK